MRELLEHRHGVDVGGVARVFFEGADAALAQHDLRVAFGEDILGGHEQFFDGGHHTAFEQHGGARLAGGVEQVVVLHVARADLDHVGVFGDEGHLLGRHGLGDHGQAGGFAGLGQQRQPLFAHALKAVGRGAGLERAAAQGGGSGLFDGVGGFENLRAAFHRARPGDDDDFGRAHFVAVEGDERVGGVHIARGQLEGFKYGHGFLYAVQQLELGVVNGAVVADHADDGGLFALREVGAVAHAFDALDDGGYLRYGSAGFHDNDHGCERLEIGN